MQYTQTQGNLPYLHIAHTVYKTLSVEYDRIVQQHTERTVQFVEVGSVQPQHKPHQTLTYRQHDEEPATHCVHK